YGAWNWRGLTSYFVALACCIPFAKLSFYTSPMAERFNGIDTAWIVGLLVGGILYYVLSRSMDLAAEQSAIELSELELQEGFEPRRAHTPAGRAGRSPTAAPRRPALHPLRGGCTRYRATLEEMPACLPLLPPPNPPPPMWSSSARAPLAASSPTTWPRRA